MGLLRFERLGMAMYGTVSCVALSMSCKPSLALLYYFDE